MSFPHNIEDVVQVVESVGVAILTIGALAVLVHSTALYLTRSRRTTSYRYFRRHLARVIMLGLEVLIIADTIQSVIVSHTVATVATLAVIVAVRIVLSWSLSVEIDGVWPWNKGRSVAEDGRQASPAPERAPGGSP